MIKEHKRIYLDHAAATPLDPRVREAMEQYLTLEFGNPGGLYQEGRRAKKVVDEARESIAHVIGARAEEIIFTSGGTESDNLAIFGVVSAVGGADRLNSESVSEPAKRGLDIAQRRVDERSVETSSGLSREEFKRSSSAKPHIVTTTFEHHAVLEPCQRLEKMGFDVTYLDVGEEGIVNLEDFKKALRPETILVSIMYANNEIGTIQPIAEIAKIIKAHRTQKIKNLAHENRRRGRAPESARVGISDFRAQDFGFNANTPFFHTDACQAAGYLDININNLGVDLMTINPNGSVGIGTTNPGVAKTYISNDGTNVGLYVGNGAPFGQAKLEIDGPAATHLWITETGNPNNPVFNVTAGGNVKIAGTVQIAGGAPATGKVLVTDNAGNASWGYATYGP